MAKDTLSSINELNILRENIENLEDYVDRIGFRQPLEGSETELLEGETLLSLIESQIPSNCAEISSRSNQTSILGENQTLVGIFKSMSSKLWRLEDYIMMKVDIMQTTSEVSRAS